MKITCNDCQAEIEIDPPTLAALQGQENFVCPACGGLVAVPVSSSPVKVTAAAAILPARVTSKVSASPSASVHRGLNHNLLILGGVTLLVLGGIGFFLASQKSGDTTTVNQNIRNEILNNTYFQNLIATGATTEQELEAIADIRPYQDGFIGISTAKLDWKEANAMALRTGATVLDADAGEGLEPWLIQSFALSSASSAWVLTRGDAGLLTGEGAFALKEADGARKVLLHWMPSTSQLKVPKNTVTLFNGSFETTGVSYIAGIGGLLEASGWTQLSPTTSYQASSALAVNPPNAEFTTTAGMATGSRYLRMQADGGNVGVLAQSLGTMTAGETYKITADIFGGPSVGALYGATICLVDQVSATPSTTYASQTVSDVADGGFSASAFNFSYTAKSSDNGKPLVLLLTTPAVGEGKSRCGGLDNVQLTVVTGPADGGKSPVTPTTPSGFSRIPAGDFTMGQDGIVGQNGIATPVHTVYVSEFYMAKYETTKELWDEVRAWGLNHGYTDLAVGNGSYALKGANHPVHSITWYDTVKWCNARSEKENLVPCYTVGGVTYKTGQQNAIVCNFAATGYRLPTEAEWEKAARGGVNGKLFSWGTDTITHDQANYNSFPAYAYDVSLTRGYHPSYAVGGYPYTAPVDSFAPNGYGLFNMSGNVWEVCWDWKEDYPSTKQINPQGAVSGSIRVGHGGGWSSDALCAHSAFRGHSEPTCASDGGGFRLAYGGSGSAASLFEIESDKELPLDEKQDLTDPETSQKPEPQSAMDSWIDTQGRVIHARFLRVEDENLVIEFKEKETRIPLSRLSAESKVLAVKRQSDSEP